MKLGWGRFRTKVLLKVLVVLCPGSVYRVLPSHQLLTSELDQTKIWTNCCNQHPSSVLEEFHQVYAGVQARFFIKASVTGPLRF